MGIIRPTHGGKGPQGRAEPGVQHIGLLNECAPLTGRARRRWAHGYNQLIAIFTGPGWDTMPPPYLPGDAPVFDIVHPFKICLGPDIRYDTGGTCLDRSNRLFCQRLDLDKPLLGEIGLNGCSTSIAMPHTMLVGLNLL